ncbi:unnamed protein product [Ectocarpus sp. 13 AM-2016]
MTSLLSKWQTAKPNRAVVTLAGDVHIGGFTDSWHNDASVPLHQMTASAVGNTPEKDLDIVKESLLRGIMHADEHMFEFKVKHHGWIFGPNFGVLDIQLATGGRPNIAMTLVPHVGDPKIRNLGLGNSKISVTDPNQSDASRAAHARRTRGEDRLQLHGVLMIGRAIAAAAAAAANSQLHGCLDDGVLTAAAAKGFVSGSPSAASKKVDRAPTWQACWCEGWLASCRRMYWRFVLRGVIIRPPLGSVRRDPFRVV